jgi:hypothetical protein
MRQEIKGAVMKSRAYTANGEARLGQQVTKEYQEIQKSKSAPMESVESEVFITAPTN